MSANQRTHLVPAVIVALALGLIPAVYRLLVLPLPPWWGGLATYLGLGLAMFSFSTLFHSVNGPRLEEAMNKLDHLGIHLLVAGTGTLHMQVLPAIQLSRVRPMLAILWALTLTGIGYRFLRGAKARRGVVMGIYIAMASTVVPTLDYGGPLFSLPMLSTFAALAVYGGATALLFPHEDLHPRWHLATIVGYLLAGLPILMAGEGA